MPPGVRKLSMIFVMVLSTSTPANVSNPLVRGNPQGLGESARLSGSSRMVGSWHEIYRAATLVPGS